MSPAPDTFLGSNQHLPCLPASQVEEDVVRSPSWQIRRQQQRRGSAKRRQQQRPRAKRTHLPESLELRHVDQRHGNLDQWRNLRDALRKVKHGLVGFIQRTPKSWHKVQVLTLAKCTKGTASMA